ncbi:hypothetical protein ACIBJI_07975 [Nocardia sp. NPDC050408]|uniref:hypothetical protein n=1 Tax=Nocardia sp. NPDC050408 TaxID=3364319 RepID=UPI003790F813
MKWTVMSELLAFFSQEWCHAALDAVNSNPTIYAGLHEPATFTNYMHFGTPSRPGFAVHLEWCEGRVVSWAPARFPEDDLWAMLNAEVDTWRVCAEQGESGSKLLMAGKIKLAKGPMNAAIQNAKALDEFLRTWGRVPTDWNV